MSLFSANAFKNKKIIISGGAGDIGTAIALGFANAGAAKIALLDRDIVSLNVTAEKVIAVGCECFKVEADLANTNAIEKAVEKIYGYHEKWDILVTTAGIFISGTLADYDIADWDLVMQINLRQVFLLSRLIAKKMMLQKSGKIVHVSSGSVFYGTPGSGPYAASKAAVNHLTQTMAVEWGEHNIQINAVCPTVTQTKFLSSLLNDALHTKMREKLINKIPMKRLLEPSDIVPAVLFLASEGTQMINGAIIPIDGGSRFVST
jgi:NAD(P)-dependent dehydrogenase (short-subunit alcohol dehydrogenase family)